MSDCRFRVSPVNYLDLDLELKCPKTGRARGEILTVTPANDSKNSYNCGQPLHRSVCMLIINKMSRAMRKRVLCHMRTTKAQISLRIRAV